MWVARMITSKQDSQACPIVIESVSTGLLCLFSLQSRGLSVLRTPTPHGFFPTAQACRVCPQPRYGRSRICPSRLYGTIPLHAASPASCGLFGQLHDPFRSSCTCVGIPCGIQGTSCMLREPYSPSCADPYGNGCISAWNPLQPAPVLHPYGTRLCSLTKRLLRNTSL